MGQEDRRARQVEQLLRYPGVGALPPQAIATNLGAQAQEIQPVLDRLVAQGRLARDDHGRYAVVGAEAARRTRA